MGFDSYDPDNNRIEVRLAVAAQAPAARPGLTPAVTTGES